MGLLDKIVRWMMVRQEEKRTGKSIEQLLEEERRNLAAGKRWKIRGKCNICGYETCDFEENFPNKKCPNCGFIPIWIRPYGLCFEWEEEKSDVE